jgi:hypothetical protein
MNQEDVTMGIYRNERDGINGSGIGVNAPTFEADLERLHRYGPFDGEVAALIARNRGTGSIGPRVVDTLQKAIKHKLRCEGKSDTEGEVRRALEDEYRRLVYEWRHRPFDLNRPVITADDLDRRTKELWKEAGHILGTRRPIEHTTIEPGPDHAAVTGRAQSPAKEDKHGSYRGMRIPGKVAPTSKDELESTHRYGLFDGDIVALIAWHHGNTHFRIVEGLEDAIKDKHAAEGKGEMSNLEFREALEREYRQIAERWRKKPLHIVGRVATYDDLIVTRDDLIRRTEELQKEMEQIKREKEQRHQKGRPQARLDSKAFGIDEAQAAAMAKTMSKQPEATGRLVTAPTAQDHGLPASTITPSKDTGRPFRS